MQHPRHAVLRAGGIRENVRGIGQEFLRILDAGAEMGQQQRGRRVFPGNLCRFAEHHMMIFQCLGSLFLVCVHTFKNQQIRILRVFPQKSREDTGSESL